METKNVFKKREEWTMGKEIYIPLIMNYTKDSSSLEFLARKVRATNYCFFPMGQGIDFPLIMNYKEDNRQEGRISGSGLES